MSRPLVIFIPVLLTLGAAALSCSQDGIKTRLPLIAGSARPVRSAVPRHIVFSFGTSDPALVPDDYSVATATAISPLITGWSQRELTVREGEMFSYDHPLLGHILVAIHADQPGAVRFRATMNDPKSGFTAVVNADGTFHFDQIIAASVVETVEPPVQSYQLYAHSTFTGVIAPDGGYSGNGAAVSLASTVAYPRAPNPVISTPTGTEGYCITYAVKSVPSKSFFGIEFYPWDDGYSDSTPITISTAASSIYDRQIMAKSHDPRSAYSYMFYWRSGFFYQVPWGAITSWDIPEIWDRF